MPVRAERNRYHFTDRNLLMMKATVRRHALGALCAFALTSTLVAARADGGSALAGSWTLVAADLLHPDGTRTSDYGAAPKGLLLIDAQGRYSLQIFKSERPRFASGDKKSGAPAEFEAAVMGSSTHFGTLDVDASAHVLTFRIDGASFPNWENTQQRRSYQLDGEQLSYRVPARPDGTVPVSLWRRLR